MLRRRWNILRLRLRSLCVRGSVERELTRELLFHLEAEIEDGRARGLSPAEAEAAARKKLGGIAQIEEECRDMRRTAMLETILQDVRFAIRHLQKAPGFTWSMVLTLGLSIGATSAIVSVVEGELIRTLPFHDTRRLVRAYTQAEN